ncbi:MAG: DUF2514 family protein [Burkholderiaceae bacterium]|jgi:hypothetical protein|nr:DUF2514 family protein [Burkholderiaceae bacterium]
MNLLGWLAPSWAIALAAALAGAALGGGVQQLRIASRDAQIAAIRLDWQTERTVLAESKAAAERQAREAETALSDKERALNVTLANHAQERAHEQLDHQERLAAAHAANRGLREQLAAIQSAYSRGAPDSTARPAAGQPPAAAAVGVLADLLGRCESRATAVAAFADAAHAAGAACQQDYEAARLATMTGDGMGR